ncbi:porin [Duganella hordei]|uniref:porin n=1 Tax=Duganella hordei TaxID=2865934 RepID=UPI0030E8C9B7
MKRNLVPILVLVPSVLATAGPAHAQGGDVQVYGRLNLGLESMRSTADARGQAVSMVRESNYRSVLGFRGSEDLGGGLKAIFQIEGTLSPDTGAGSPAARDTRVGLEGAAGTLFAGNWVTPYNGATAGLDPYYPTTAGYMSIMGNGSASTSDNVSDTSSFDRRQQNSVHYWSPQWHGLQLRLAHGLNEEHPAGGARPALTSAAAVWERGPWYAAAAYERHYEYQGKDGNDSGAKIAAAYRFGDTRVALIGERLKYETAAGTLERNAAYIAVTHQIGPHGLRLGLARAGDGTGSAPDGQKVGFIRKGEDTGATHYTAGYDYALSRRSSLFLFYTRLANQRNGSYDFAINGLTVSPGATVRGLALGMRHAF